MTANEIKEIQALIKKTEELQKSLLEISDKASEEINAIEYISFLSNQLDEMKWKVYSAKEKLKNIPENITVIDFHAPSKVEEPKKVEEKKNIRFLMYKVTNGDNTVKIDYSRREGGIMVYGKTYSEQLTKIFDADEVIDNSDSMTDYFEYERVFITEDSPYWKQVNTQCKKREAKNKNNY